MLDLQLPRPLLNPVLWPTPDPKDPPLFSLSHLKYGGAFAKLRTDWQNENPGLRLAFAVPETFWGQEALEEPSFVVLLESEFESFQMDLEIISRLPLTHHEQRGWRELGERTGRTLHFVLKPDLVSPSLLDWSKEIFPESYRAAGDVHWRRELKEYESQLPHSLFAIDHFRFWPGFLQSRGLPFAPTTALEWANVQALFSPQGDRSGPGEITILNPTVEVVMDRRSATTLARAVWRIDGSLSSKDLTWQEAAAIDELRENPRILLTHLILSLKAKRFPFKTEMGFENVIESMIQQGLILRRR